MSAPGRGKSTVRRPFDPSRRIWIVASLLVAASVMLTARLAYIQIGQFGGRLAQTQEKLWSSRLIQPKRGRVVDRQGRLMAAVTEAYAVFARPGRVKDRDKLARILARHRLIPYEEALNRLNTSLSFVWLSRNINPDLTKTLNADLEGIDGVGLVREYRRSYPLGHVGASLIGFVGVDGHGLGGLEFQYDQELTGDAGALEIVLGEHGMPMVRDSQGNVNPTFKGHDIELAMDAYVQEQVDAVLQETVITHAASQASAVVVDPRSGEVLAMGSMPRFDPNRFWEYPPSAHRNISASVLYEPGSTFKIISMAAVLGAPGFTTAESYNCQGSLKAHSGHTVRCYANHGRIDYGQAVDASCNVGIIQAAQRHVDRNTFYTYIRDFGFGISTSSGLPGEERGILRKPGRWSLSSDYSITIGQEVAVTNLQLAMAAAAVANGGELLRPITVRRVLDENGNTIRQFERQVVRRVIDRGRAYGVTRLLVSAVENGTGKKAALPGVRVAGKTGTAQMANLKTGGYEAGRFVSSFVGYFPAESPEVLISIVVFEPDMKTGYFGGDVAAPAFQRIAAFIQKNKLRS